MLTRRDAALRLDIPLEMATRHGIPARLSEAELAAIEQDPPAWLVQSRANRTGKKPVWVHLECVVCGFAEDAQAEEVVAGVDVPARATTTAPTRSPEPAEGYSPTEVDDIGSRFIAMVDWTL